MTSLNEIKGINKYCGPAVLAAMTGLSTDECAAAIQSVTGQKSDIKAIQMYHLITTFNRLRFDMKEIKTFSSTLYGTLSELSVENDARYIIAVPHHVIAIEVVKGYVYFIDNHTKVPIDARGSARLTQRVEQVYKITAKEIPVFVRSEIRLINNHRGINFVRFSIFKNCEDNVRVDLGYISKASIEELLMIHSSLGDMIEDLREKNSNV